MRASPAIERDPVHELRVEEVPGAAAHLPDPFVDVLPAQHRPVGDVREERAELRVDLDPQLRDLSRRVDQLAVDVELGLVPRAVADAHRPAVVVTRQRVRARAPG